MINLGSNISSLENDVTLCLLHFLQKYNYPAIGQDELIVISSRSPTSTLTQTQLFQWVASDIFSPSMWSVGQVQMTAVVPT